jgi:DNA-binding transcriptional LysR family regulator
MHIVEIRQLRQLIALSETLSFHKAALRLNMAQPPLSVSIRKLEQELGVRLFIRSQRGVSLTSAGQEALAHAREALFATEKLRASVREHGVGLRGRLRIGFVGSAAYGLLPKILPPFRKAYPAVSVVLVETTTFEGVRDLERQALDVALVRLPLLEAADIDLTVLERDQLVVALRGDDPLARRRRIGLRTLAERPFILYSQTSVLHRTIMIACQRAGFVPRVAQQATQVSTILCLVESGLGIGLVPATATGRAPRGVKFLPLMESPAIELGLALARNWMNPLAANFRRAALEAVEG